MKKKNLSQLFTLLFFAVFFIYFFTHLHSFEPLLSVSLGPLLLIIITKMIVYLVNGLFMQWTVEVFTGKLRFFEAVYIAILSSIGNFFGPLLGGAAIRAVYLKKIHHLSYTLFTSTLAGYYVIIFAANSALALISLKFLNVKGSQSGLIVFFAVWLVAMIGLMFLRLPQRERFARLESYRLTKYALTTLYEIESGWKRITTTRWLLPKLTLLGLSGFVITYINALIEFHAINVSISTAALGFYTAVSTMSVLISLTPGAIGIRESLLLLTSSVMGVTNAQILQVAVIDRGMTFLLLGVLFAASKVLRPKDELETAIEV